MNEKELVIQSILETYLKDYTTTQEITFAGRLIGKAFETKNADVIEESVQEAHAYLIEFDKEFIPMQTVNTKSIFNNQVKLAISEIRKAIKEMEE